MGSRRRCSNTPARNQNFNKITHCSGNLIISRPRLRTLSRTNSASWREWKEHATWVIQANNWGDRRAKLMVKLSLLGDAGRVTWDVKPNLSDTNGQNHRSKETWDVFLDRLQRRILARPRWFQRRHPCPVEAGTAMGRIGRRVTGSDSGNKSGF